MTIIVAFKVGDGLVFGADSASTMLEANGEYANSYFNAEKLFHLAHELPVGLVTCGLGGLANRSISSLVTDLRRRVSTVGTDWYVDPLNFTIREIVEKMKSYFYDELYHPEYDGAEKLPTLSFLIGGYSSGATSSEVWRLFINGEGVCEEPLNMIELAHPANVVWDGQTEAIRRLVIGYSWDAVEALKSAGIPEDQAVAILSSNKPMFHGAMPIQDAIDFVHYLIDVTCGYVRFCPGQATVAHPIDSAAITKNNGFKWIRRKHYYSQDLNR